MAGISGDRHHDPDWGSLGTCIRRAPCASRDDAVMGIRLVCEVLDHYHGPEARKLWLIAWAESANDRTRTGWPTREQLAHRTGKSPARASNIATELCAEGVLKRDGGGNRGGPARFVLLPLEVTEKGSELANPKDDVKGSELANPSEEVKGSPKPNPKPEVKGSESKEKGSESARKGSDPTALPAETGSLPLTIPSEDLPSKDMAVAEAPATPTAQTILGNFIDWVRANGGDLTQQTTGRLARQLGKLVAEGKPDRLIRQGLADWFVSGKNVSLLDDFVNAAINADARNRLTQHGRGTSPASQPTPDERVNGHIESGRRIQAFMDQNGGLA